MRVGAAVNGIVRALEEQRLAIEHQLDAGIAEFFVESREAFAREHDGSDVLIFPTCTSPAG